MIDKVLCWNCGKIMTVEVDSFHELEEHETILIERCPSCNSLNAVSFYVTTNLEANEPDDDDKKCFPDQFNMEEEVKE